MSLKHRLQCLQWLKEIGYQTGTGIMVGTPGQTLTHLVEDLLFIEQFQPQMIGIGPFIPHHDTPFGTEPAGSVGMTLKLLSLFRLMHPSALIPSTTALATLSPDGREKGILAGANVVMPNLSPREQRENTPCMITSRLRCRSSRRFTSFGTTTGNNRLPDIDR